MENIDFVFEKACADEAGQACKEEIPCRWLMGSLLYLSTNSRSCITFAENLRNLFMETTLRAHWVAAKCILRYLVGTSGHVSLIGNVSDDRTRTSETNFTLSAFRDSHWVRDIQSKKSRSGYGILYNGGLVCWWSDKQNVLFHLAWSLSTPSHQNVFRSSISTVTFYMNWGKLEFYYGL